MDHFIRSLVGGPTITQQIGKAGREGSPLALRKSKDFSAGMSCGLFAPPEVINFAIESSHVSLHARQMMSPDLCNTQEVLNLQAKIKFGFLVCR
jgi:hypothetical protein